MKTWLVMAGLCVAAAEAQDFPCKINDYRIIDSKTLVFLCDAVPVAPRALSITGGSLFFVENESIVRPAVGQIDAKSSGIADEQWWLSLKFEQPLTGQKDYELQFAGSLSVPDERIGGAPARAFTGARLRFSTKGAVGVVRPTNREFGLQGHIALDEATLAGTKLSQKPSSASAFRPLASKLLPVRDSGYDSVGEARVDPIPTDTSGVFKVEGLKDIFGDMVTIDPTKHAPPITIPKNKVDANYYFNFLHEAGIGVTPTWVADVKVAPILGRLPGDLYWAPSFIANVGTGSVGDTKATDDIKGSLGVTRWLRNNGIFEGIQATPAFSYETDRENDKRNAFFDGDVQFFLKGLSNTKAERQTDLFLKCKALPNVKLEEATELQKTPMKVCTEKGLEKSSQLADAKVDFGYRFQFLLGTEDGGALVATTAKSTDKSSQVTVPTYAIARVRPRMVTTFEWKAVTLTITAIPRYLLATENVTRQTPAIVNGITKQKIFLGTVSGWRPYGEVGVNIALDPTGHYAVGTTYKVGVQPPNFIKGNVFQSGLIIRF